MTEYRSQGTIRIEVSLAGDRTTCRAFFTPASDYHVKHSGNDHAIFLNDSDGKSISRKYNAKEKEEIEICIDPKDIKCLLPNLPFLCTGQVKVEITVKECRTPICKSKHRIALKKFVVPAK